MNTFRAYEWNSNIRQVTRFIQHHNTYGPEIKAERGANYHDNTTPKQVSSIIEIGNENYGNISI